MQTEVVVLVKDTDVATLQFSVPYIIANLNPKKLTIITNNPSAEAFGDFKGYSNVRVVDENSLVEGLTFSRIKQLIAEKNGDVKRTGWYFQQFLKMAYAYICEDDFYLTWDADTVPVREINMFSENGKACFDIKTENNPLYFQTLNRILGINKQINASFISEHMLFYKDILFKLFDDITKKTGKSFFECIIDAIDTDDFHLSAFSEFETYGSYCMVNYPERYELRVLPSFRRGTVVWGEPSKKAIKAISKYTNYSVVSFERAHDYNKYFKMIFRLCGYNAFSMYVCKKLIHRFDMEKFDIVDLRQVR